MDDTYVPDHLFARLFLPRTLPESEHPLCREDWARVKAICALPWHGRLLDVGSGDGALAGMVCGLNALVTHIDCYEPDPVQKDVWNPFVYGWMIDWHVGMFKPKEGVAYTGALCCEVLEHVSPSDGLQILSNIKQACAPGAMICVTVPFSGGSRATYPGHIQKFTGDSLRAMLINAGLGEPRLSFIRPNPDKHATWIMAVCHV